MPIRLDDAPLTTDGPRLRDAIAAAVLTLQNQGRMLVEVKIDGDTVPEAQLEDRADDSVEASQVELFSANPTALTTSVLEQCRGRLDDARDLQEDAAELLQRDQVGDGLSKLGDSIEPWLQTQQAVAQSAVIAGIDLNTFDLDGQPLIASIEALLTQLKDLKQLIEAQDTIALADALAYEWPETTDRWDKLLAALIDRIESGA
ncbi:MAG: hypothetical protein AAGI68_03485 [Planctomycetota bacterium]